MEFQFNKYNLDLTGIIHKVTKNDTTYIYNTCHSYFKKSHIPAQAICNKLQILEVPAEIKNLNKLESILIARKKFFKKLQLCQRVSFQNVKVLFVMFQSIHQILRMFFHTVQRCSGLIMVKLKRKLSFRGHFCFSPFSPESVYLAPCYLKVKNPYYKDITIDMGTLPSDLTEIDCPGPSDTLEEDENLQH